MKRLNLFRRMIVLIVLLSMLFSLEGSNGQKAVPLLTIG